MDISMRMKWNIRVNRFVERQWLGQSQSVSSNRCRWDTCRKEFSSDEGLWWRESNGNDLNHYHDVITNSDTTYHCYYYLFLPLPTSNVVTLKIFPLQEQLNHTDRDGRPKVKIACSRKLGTRAKRLLCKEAYKQSCCCVRCHKNLPLTLLWYHHFWHGSYHKNTHWHAG